MGGDEGEGGAASEVFRVYNQPFRQLTVTLSPMPSPIKGISANLEWIALYVIRHSGESRNPVTEWRHTGPPNQDELLQSIQISIFFSSFLSSSPAQ